MRIAINVGAALGVLGLAGAAWLVLADPGRTGSADLVPESHSPPPATAVPPPAAGPSEPAAAIETQPLAAEHHQVSGAGRIQGRLLSADERPVTGGNVVARSQVRRDGRWRSVEIPARTDGDGRFLIGNLPPGSWFVDAHDEGRSLARPEKITLPVEAPTVTITLRLAAGATLDGTVRDPEGHLITGVKLTVTATDAEGKRGLSDPVATRTTVTDGSGRYEFAGLRAGCRFTLAAEHPEYFATEETKPFAVDGDAARDIVLVPFATLGGRVEGKDGAPVAGAEVECDGLASAPTGADGRFTIPRLRADGGAKEVLAATADLDLAGRAPVSLRPGEVRDDFVIRISRTARIRGRVTDILGTGVGGAMVTAAGVPEEAQARAGTSYRSLTEWVANPGNGQVVAFENFGLRLNAIRSLNETISRHSAGIILDKVKNFEAHAAVGSPFWAHDEPSAAVASVDPPEETAPQAMIFDAADGTVSARVRLDSALTSLVTRSGTMTWKVQTTPILLRSGEWTFGGAAPSEGAVAIHVPRPLLRARLEGPFTAVADGEGAYVILGLGPGSFRITAAADGFFSGGPEHPVLLSADGDEARADILLRRGAVISGTLAGGGEAPPESVSVTLRNSDGGSDHTVPWAPEFEIASLPAGRFDLRARLDKDPEAVAEVHGLVLELDGVISGVALEFAPGAEVRGLVKDATGAPVPGAAVVLDAPGGEVSATTDDLGGFRIGGLFSGGARIQAKAEGFLDSDQDAIDIPARSRVIHEITLHRGHVVTGHVRDRDGTDAGSAMVVLRSPRRTLSGQTAEDGRFRIENVPPDAYKVYARTDDYRRNTRSQLVVDRDADPPPLVLQLAESFVARGRLIDATGAAREGATVVATATDNDSLHRQGPSRPDGSFEIPNLYPGAYTLSVEGVESDPAFFEVQPGRAVPFVVVTVR